MMVTPQAFIQGMRQLAAGVTVVTAIAGGRRAGLTATAVCSVSAEPPQLLVCINREAETHEIVTAGGCFAINLLAADQQHLARAFAGRSGVHGDRRFAQARWTTLVTGAPVLASCLAAFDCRLIQIVPAASHGIVLGRVEAVTIEPDRPPLVYAEGDYGLVAPIGGGLPGPETESGPAW
jgi:flavin reductase (DIM6/NTAB) family NADH-FMN oxidoreductase RutF